MKYVFSISNSMLLIDRNEKEDIGEITSIYQVKVFSRDVFFEKEKMSVVNKYHNFCTSSASGNDYVKIQLRK